MNAVHTVDLNDSSMQHNLLDFILPPVQVRQGTRASHAPPVSAPVSLLEVILAITLNTVTESRPFRVPLFFRLCLMHHNRQV